MKIIDLAVSRLRKPDIAEYGHNVIEDAEQCPTITEKMGMWYTPMCETYNIMYHVYLISHRSDLTDEIHNLINQRYAFFASFSGAVNGLRKSYNEETMRQATSVWKTINSYRPSATVQYNTQTGQMDALIDILKTKQRENVEALGLWNLVELMDSTNERIHILLGDRDVENIDKTDGDFQMAREQFEKAYRDFVTCVNSWYFVKVITEGAEDSMLKFFIEKTNSRIVRLKKTLLHIPTASPEAGETEDNPDDPQMPVTPEGPDGEPVNPDDEGNTGTGDEENQNPTEGDNNGENTGGTPPSQENPNQPPPPTGGGESGFD